MCLTGILGMSTASNVLVLIQRNAIQYGFPILLVLANLGNLLFLCAFLQKMHRQHPCSLYLLTSAIICLIGANWGFATHFNALYQTPDPFVASLFLCRLRSYILQTTLVLHRSMIVLACFDRYALSSTNPRIRSFSNKPFAIKCIIGTAAFWCVFMIQHPFFQTIQSNRCGMFGNYGLVFSIYQILVLNILLPGLMICLGTLLFKNLHNTRFRTMRQHSLSTGPLSKRDVSLVKFVLAEAIVTILLSTLSPINTLYGVLTNDVPNKTVERIETETFLSFLTEHVLLYMNYCVTFYLYVIMSKTFRSEIIRLLLKFYRCPKRVKRSSALETVSLRLMPSNSNRVHAATA